LNANGLEIKQRVQRGMAFIDLTNIFATAAKELNFYCVKWISDFGQKYEIHILVKNTIFPSSFSIVV